MGSCVRLHDRKGKDALRLDRRARFRRAQEVLVSLQAQARLAFGIPDPRLDIVAFDACDVATVELACQLHGYADYLVGSQIGVPIPGWPYDRVLERLQDPQGRLMGAAELGSWIVRRFCELYTSQRSVSLSLLDLKRAPELFARTKVLAMLLKDAIDRDIDFLDVAADLFARSLTAEDKPYVDVADLCLNLRREVGDPLVNEAARALGDFLITPEQCRKKQSDRRGVAVRRRVRTECRRDGQAERHQLVCASRGAGQRFRGGARYLSQLRLCAGHAMERARAHTCATR